MWPYQSRLPVTQVNDMDVNFLDRGRVRTVLRWQRVGGLIFTTAVGLLWCYFYALCEHFSLNSFAGLASQLQLAENLRYIPRIMRRTA